MTKAMYKYTSELGADELDTGLWCALQPENMKIRIMGTYLRFGIVALIFLNCGNLSKKIGIVGTYQKNRKKSELWEHIYI
jgi:hypothetical protein